MSAEGFKVSQEPDVWAKVPYWLPTVVSPNAVIVYIGLCRYVNMPDGCRPGVALVAKDLGCSVRKVQRGIVELAEAGAIDIELRYKANGQQDTSRYYLHVSAPRGLGKGGGKSGTPSKNRRSDGDDNSDTPNLAPSEKPSSQGATDSSPSPEGGDRFDARGVTDSSPEIDRGEIDREKGGLREVSTSLARDPAKTPPSSESAPKVTRPGAGSAAPSTAATNIGTAYRRLDKTILGSLRPYERERARELLTSGLSVEEARSTLTAERAARLEQTRNELRLSVSVGEGSS